MIYLISIQNQKYVIQLCFFLNNLINSSIIQALQQTKDIYQLILTSKLSNQQYMLKTFLQSYGKGLPQAYKKLISSLEKHPNFFVHYPIVATTNNHPLNIKIRTAPQVTSIPKGANIFMLSTTQSFSNIQLIGASVQDKAQVDNFFNENANKYEALQNQDMRGLFKILIQIYANQAVIDNGQMPLHYFANLLMSQSYSTQQSKQMTGKYANAFSLGLDFDKKKYLNYVKSHHLTNMLKTSEVVIERFYEILSNNFIKTTNFEEFSNLFKLVRAQLRQIKQHSNLNHKSNQQNMKIQVLSPILPSLRFSHTPNCVLVGKYFTHLRQSYYCLQNLRELKGDQQLTVPYRKDTSNYEKILRYGYKSITQQQNKDNSYLLIVNLMDPQIQQVNDMMLTGDVDKKKDILAYENMKMKNVIKIKNNGQIYHQDLKMLRILNGIEKRKQFEAEKLQIDKKIYNFINKFVQGQIQSQKRHQKQKKQMKDGQNDQVLKSLKIIEREQGKILDKFVQYNKQVQKR